MSTRISAAIQSVMQRYSIVGNSPALLSAIERALQVAPIDLSVLVIGESGAGKEFFPQIIHSNSSRKHNKYIAVNCGAIPEGTIDSELFGHEKGAFTGAISSRKGYFEEANGGTIFLDEVAELPLTTQARLLRVLESGEYIKVGSSEVQKTNIRVVAATNKDMQKAVADGKFREDLYYRLSTVQINVPPLRSRGDDVLLLVRRFSNNFAETYRMPPVTFSPEACEAIKAYHWPGNVRQLKNVIEQIALFEAGKTVDGSTIDGYLPRNNDNNKPVLIDGAKFDYTQEREYLFKMIFQLQKEFSELQSQLKSQGRAVQHSDMGIDATTAPAHISLDVADLKRDSSDFLRLQRPSSLMAGKRHGIDVQADYEEPEFSAHEIKATPVDDNMAEAAGRPVKTLEDTERETIIRALDRNHGKRKKTAMELNISERTLYRKIKEYGLESRNNN